VLEPQGTLFFVVLVLAFAGLVTWLALSKLVVVRVLVGLLAFLPAAAFGVAAVNKYYDYYQTWDSLFSDLSGSGAQSVPQLAEVAGASSNSSIGRVISAAADNTLSEQTGYLFRTTVMGPASHIRRQVYVYLPPQYFQPAYRNARFPAIELLHGSPGQPASWINVMDVIPIYLGLLDTKQATPAVLVMPDTDGGLQYSLQCLNNPGGIQDMTFIGKEVPDWVTSNLRVMPAGPSWGIAGYSEGGYCAANVGLQDASRFGYVGSMSGYFAPSNSQVPATGRAGGTPVNVPDVFARYPKLALLNTPYKYVQEVPLGVQVPYFWLAAGGNDTWYLQQAEVFRQYALTRVPDIPFMVVPGGGHSASVWRAALGPMLEWMTPKLTNSVVQVDEDVARREMAQRERERHLKKSSRPKSAPTQSAI
jgi:enterochelin esterase-like enzyme